MSAWYDFIVFLILYGNGSFLKEWPYLYMMAGKLYISYWRGLTALLILCGWGNAKAYGPGMGRTDTYAFFCIK